VVHRVDGDTPVAVYMIYDGYYTKTLYNPHTKMPYALPYPIIDRFTKFL